MTSDQLPEETIQPIFLDLLNREILELKRPPIIQRSDVIYFDDEIYIPDGSTELTSYCGTNRMDEIVGNYRIIGSASKYMAMLAELGDKVLTLEAIDQRTNKPKEKMLFSGGIEIYRKGIIPDTDFEGFDFVRQGRVYFAIDLDKEYRSKWGLKKLVLGTTNKCNDPKRIESIIYGYEEQDILDSKNQSARENESFMDGRYQQRERDFGTFGRGSIGEI